MAREDIRLSCSVCGRRNYTISKNKQKHPERIEMTKFCKYCNTRTLHKETR